MVVQNFTFCLWISHCSLQSVSSGKVFRSPFSHVFCQRAINALIGATNKSVNQGRTQRAGLSFCATDILSTLTSSPAFGFNISTSYVQLIFLSCCPRLLSFWPYHYHKTLGVQRSHEWGNEVCPQRLVLGGTKLSLRGHCLYFRALRNCL